jgi:hypothetical protein
MSNNNPTRDGAVVRAMRVLNAQTSTGAGTVFHLGRAYSAFGIEYVRGSTTATLESTAATVQLQGQIGSTAKWHNLGAAVTVNNTSATIVRSTNAIPVHRIRATITGFTTSAGAASTAERRVAVSVWVSAGFGSS